MFTTKNTESLRHCDLINVFPGILEGVAALKYCHSKKGKLVKPLIIRLTAQPHQIIIKTAAVI